MISDGNSFFRVELRFGRVLPVVSIFFVQKKKLHSVRWKQLSLDHWLYRFYYYHMIKCNDLPKLYSDVLICRWKVSGIEISMRSLMKEFTDIFGLVLQSYESTISYDSSFQKIRYKRELTESLTPKSISPLTALKERLAKNLLSFVRR